MIYILYCSTATYHPRFDEYLQQFPPVMQAQIQRYRRWQDAHNSLFGKLLLMKGLALLNLDYTLNDLKYTNFKKPYIDASFDFNISHSGGYVLCAISQTNKVGVDIEETKPTTIDEFKDLFHESEWAQITRQIDNPSEFYNFWTKKESFIKVIGTGLHMPLNKFSVLDNKLTWENKNWYFFNLQIAPGYIAHLATDTKAPHIDTQMIHFD